MTAYAKHSDLFLVNQEFARYLYRDPAPYEDALYKLVSGYATAFRPDGLKITSSPKVGFEEMSSPPFLLAFLNTVIKLAGVKTVLEIGAFVGHTAMQFARMVGSDGHVTTIEVFKEFADIARTNFAQNGFEGRITLLEGNAGTVLTGLPKRSFDLVFIDGAKQSYLDYALIAEGLITKKGVIIVDDVFFHGDAVNAAPTTEKGIGCKKLLEHYHADQNFEHLLLPLRNGLLLIYPRTSERL